MFESCHGCGVSFRAANWQLVQSGPGEWMGLNVAPCAACGHLHIAAAGSTFSAYEDAQKVRRKLLQEITKKQVCGSGVLGVQ